MNNWDRLLIAFGVTCATSVALAAFHIEAGAVFGVLTVIVLAFMAILEGS